MLIGEKKQARRKMSAIIEIQDDNMTKMQRVAAFFFSNSHFLHTIPFLFLIDWAHFAELEHEEKQSVSSAFPIQIWADAF